MFMRMEKFQPTRNMNTNRPHVPRALEQRAVFCRQYRVKQACLNEPYRPAASPILDVVPKSEIAQLHIDEIEARSPPTIQNSDNVFVFAVFD